MSGNALHSPSYGFTRSSNSNVTAHQGYGGVSVSESFAIVRSGHVQGCDDMRHFIGSNVSQHSTAQHSTARHSNANAFFIKHLQYIKCCLPPKYRSKQRSQRTPFVGSMLQYPITFLSLRPAAVHSNFPSSASS
jgi:hypothetical protein